MAIAGQGRHLPWDVLIEAQINKIIREYRFVQLILYQNILFCIVSRYSDDTGKRKYLVDGLVTDGGKASAIIILNKIVQAYSGCSIRMVNTEGYSIIMRDWRTRYVNHATKAFMCESVYTGVYMCLYSGDHTHCPWNKKKDITPWLAHRSYVFLLLTHRHLY